MNTIGKMSVTPKAIQDMLDEGDREKPGADNGRDKRC
jgi:hypothetical protein